jgi:hypothetical protein
MFKRVKEAVPLEYLMVQAADRLPSLVYDALFM